MFAAVNIETFAVLIPREIIVKASQKKRPELSNDASVGKRTPRAITFLKTSSRIYKLGLEQISELGHTDTDKLGGTSAAVVKTTLAARAHFVARTFRGYTPSEACRAENGYRMRANGAANFLDLREKKITL